MDDSNITFSSGKISTKIAPLHLVHRAALAALALRHGRGVRLKGINEDGMVEYVMQFAFMVNWAASGSASSADKRASLIVLSNPPRTPARG